MKQRMVNTKFWSDDFVVDKLNPLDRYLFLYFLTNERTNISGIYELSQTVICRETGIDKETLPVMLKTLEPKVYYFQKWVILPKFPKNQNQNSPKVKIGIFNELSQIPKEVLEYAISIGYVYGIDTLSHLNLNSNLNSNLKKESQNQNFAPPPSGKPKTEKGWRDLRRYELGKPPTVTPRTKKQDEVFAALKWKDYFRDQGSKIHGMEFFKVHNEKREKIVSKLIISAYTEVNGEMKALIDWWFAGQGEWAQYEPEQCFSVKTLEKFINKGKGKKEKTLKEANPILNSWGVYENKS